MAVGLPVSANRAGRRFGPRPDDPGIDMASRRDPYPNGRSLAGCLWTIDRQAASDLLSFMIDLLTHDHEPRHASS
jgi:hypothetical protein